MHNSERVEGRGGQGIESTFQLLLHPVNIFHVWYLLVIIKENGLLQLLHLQHCRKMVNILDNVSLSVLILQKYHTKMLQAFCLLLYMVLGLIAIPVQS